jgi:HPt (histidine-containing phosphotransfer) domain-containing protein
MVIDRAAVVQLLGGNEEAADQLLDGFVQINTPCIAKLADLARRHEWDAVAEMAHRLLGSARTAAAQPLAQALTALESAARHGKPQDFAELIRSVAVEFERVRDWLDSDQRLNQA